MDRRTAKIVLMASVALYASLVAINNLMDYGSNFDFVRHVLLMDTTFPDNSLRWRRVDTLFLHHAAYIGIIATECLVAGLGWLATLRLWRARASAQDFAASKPLANLSLLLGFLLWFTGFIVIGGEWLVMWQSQIWNGIESAYRIASILLLVLVFMNMDD